MMFSSPALEKELPPGASETLGVQCCSLEIGQERCMDRSSADPWKSLVARKIQTVSNCIKMIKMLLCAWRQKFLTVLTLDIVFWVLEDVPCIWMFKNTALQPEDCPGTNLTPTRFCTALQWVHVKRRVNGRRHWLFWKRCRKTPWRRWFNVNFCVPKWRSTKFL